MALSQNSDMQRCIDACIECHRTCLQMAMGDCIRTDGNHAEPELIRLMLNCAELCQTTANFMISDSPVHGIACNACAQVCDACTQSCEEVSGMEECVRACRYCAESCEQMSQQQFLRGVPAVSGTVASAHA